MPTRTNIGPRLVDGTDEPEPYGDPARAVRSARVLPVSSEAVEDKGVSLGVSETRWQRTA